MKFPRKMGACKSFFRRIVGTVDTDDFEWSYTQEPHASRRKAILKAHPEVSKLMGHCPRTKWVCLSVVAAQMCIAAYMGLNDKPWWLLVTVAYAFGGTVNHMMLLAMHEISHNLAFKKPDHNRLFGMFINLITGVPAYVMFKKYHIDHHKMQGWDAIDTDIPSWLETVIFVNTPLKALWCLLQPFMYGLRPLFVNPKAPCMYAVLNNVSVIAFNVLVWQVLGCKAALYLILGTLLGMGLHPVAGHFIAEHYMFVEGQETYSYYGPLNAVAFNVGFHNEHHDFPFIPGSRLPKLKALAPEFYDKLPTHASWTMVRFCFAVFPPPPRSPTHLHLPTRNAMKNTIA